MRIIIVPEDKTVIVDGKRHNVDCSSLAPDIHAVQWHGNWGEIEFKEIDGIRQPNQRIEDMLDFESVIQLWNAENAKAVKQPNLPLRFSPEVQARIDMFNADIDRQNLGAFLRRSTPDDIRRYVDQSVKDIDSAKKLLATILVAIAPPV